MVVATLSQQVFEVKFHKERQTAGRSGCLSKPLTADRFKELCNHIDTFIFDADGVLWLGDNVMPGSPKLIDYLISRKKTVIVLTNNATKSRAVYSKKLAKMGYHAKLDKVCAFLEETSMFQHSLVNPSAVAADLLKQKGFGKNGHGKKVYLIGSQGMREEMDELNIEYFGHGPEPQDHSDGSAFIFDIQLKEPVSFHSILFVETTIFRLTTSVPF